MSLAAMLKEAPPTPHPECTAAKNAWIACFEQNPEWAECGQTTGGEREAGMESETDQHVMRHAAINTHTCTHSHLYECIRFYACVYMCSVLCRESSLGECEARSTIGMHRRGSEQHTQPQQQHITRNAERNTRRYNNSSENHHDDDA